jgi:hypothetical protein
MQGRKRKNTSEYAGFTWMRFVFHFMPRSYVLQALLPVFETVAASFCLWLFAKYARRFHSAGSQFAQARICCCIKNNRCASYSPCRKVSLFGQQVKISDSSTIEKSTKSISTRQTRCNSKQFSSFRFFPPSHCDWLARRKLRDISDRAERSKWLDSSIPPLPPRR